MKPEGNVPTSITCAPKGRYVITDVHRWADHYAVTLNWHPQQRDIDASRLSRATLVAGQLDAMPAAVEVAVVLGAAGPDAEEVKGAMDQPAEQVLLEEATARVVSPAVFGAPTLFVGDEMFFGNDRLRFVQDHLTCAAWAR